MQCQCRMCGKVYDSRKARGDYTGYCSAKCQHEKARLLGYRKKGGITEGKILSQAKCIGDVPVESERVKLKAELVELEESRYASPYRIQTIKGLLKTKLRN